MSVCKDLDALSSAELKRLLTREGVSFWASCCIGSKKLIRFFYATDSQLCSRSPFLRLPVSLSLPVP